MLPSTGYFKGINCPFYDSGLCERPYCHFRHVKKDIQNSSDGIESGAILQKLVSAAVQKVLQQSDPSGVVTTQPAAGENAANDLNSVQSLPKATYNPTPISELKKISNTDSGNSDDSSEQRKRHIPVPYTPRKPASIPIKRPIESDEVSKPFIYNPPPVKYTPGSTETAPLDPYTPKGSVETKEKYLPGTEVELPEYTPRETLSSTKVSYVPSDKSSNKKKILLEYKPVKVTAKKETSSVTYQPTPRSLVPCFSSDEDEPKNKKRKLSNDLNGFDDLGPEFEILDEILDEETSKPIELIEDEKKHEIQNKVAKDLNKIKNVKKERSSSRSEKSRDKDKLDDKTKTSSNKKDKHSRSTESSDKKSSQKSSHKDKSKEDKDKKPSSEKKKHSSPKRTDKNTKYIEKETKKDKQSQHRSSSKSSSKKENKSNHKKSHKSSKESKDKHKKYKKKESFTNNISDNDSNHIEDDIEIEKIEEDLYDSSESDEEAITLECKKIFEEYVPVQKVTIEDKSDKVDDANEEYIPSKKRVSRTVDKNIKVIPRAPVKPDYKVNAAQAMAERLAKVKEFHASKDKVNSSPNKIPIEPQNNTVQMEPPKNTYSTPSAGSKIRIAHVPYASTLMNAKRTISSNSNAARVEASTSSTIVQTVKKGVQRVAHMPNEKFIDRPGVLEPLASKIAANIRSTYLNMMIDECLKIYLTATDAYARAQHEELTTSKKCSTVQIYKNSAVLTVSRLRKELVECNGVKKSGTDCLALQKIPKAVSGTTGNAGSWSIENKNWRVSDTSQEFNGAKLYKNISKWILDEQQLQDNGFPRPHSSGDKGRAMIYGQKKQNPPRGFIRTCCRCKKDYTVDKRGFAAVKEECIYHPNNKYRVRGEVRYQCCSQDGTSDGCCIAPSHVYEYVDYENLKGYVRTFPPEKMMDDYGVYSLDCEMCYTTQGLDLTRITVINSSCKVIYETLIRPLHPIIDYNTRYSGITEEQMSNVKTTLLEVQATLLSMFSSKTILIGHSLESDFKALKLIHDTVIDTSVLFPHKMGPPYKRALRNLSSEYLKKIIQNSVEGHDSAEDATVCMELIHFKLKEDLKTR